VYNHDSSNGNVTWKQSGDDLKGESGGDKFSSNTLSSDGKYLVVGAQVGNYVDIYEKIGSNYTLIEEKITSGEGMSFGREVAMSADGAVIAIGDYDFEINTGKVYSLERDVYSSAPSMFPSLTPSEVPSQVPSLNPTKESSPGPLNLHH